MEPKAPLLLWKALREPHLPQGAPTSPTLAKLVLFEMDVRLAALARTFGATYTRYADDQVFSGGAPLAERVSSLLEIVRVIVQEEGCVLRSNKTRVQREHRQQKVAGLVVNARPAVAREDFDRLKAALFQCKKRPTPIVERSRA